MFKAAGFNLRTPGMYKKRDTVTGKVTNELLQDTNERVHSSVRVRLALGCLGLNDGEVWEAPALKANWRLQITPDDIVDPIPSSMKTWQPSVALSTAAIAKRHERRDLGRKLAGLGNT